MIIFFYKITRVQNLYVAIVFVLALEWRERQLIKVRE